MKTTVHSLLQVDLRRLRGLENEEKLHTKSSSTVVLHFSKLIRLTAHCSIRGIQ